MARYQDYVNQDTIEDEISDAGANAAQRQGFEIPDRFRADSMDEVARKAIESHAELEKAFSRQGNDLGELRKTVDSLIAMESQRQEPEVPPAPVTVDDIYDDPDGAIGRVVEQRAEKRIQELENRLAEGERSRQVDDLTSKYPGWKEDVNSDQFRAWVNESKYRQRLAADADGWDLDAADDLFAMYYGNKQEGDTTQLEATLRDATLESGSSIAQDTEQKFSRTDIVNHKRRAKLGMEDSRAWLAQNQAAITLAYAEGRVVD